MNGLEGNQDEDLTSCLMEFQVWRSLGDHGCFLWNKNDVNERCIIMSNHTGTNTSRDHEKIVLTYNYKTSKGRAYREITSNQINYYYSKWKKTNKDQNKQRRGQREQKKKQFVHILIIVVINVEINSKHFHFLL